MPCIHICYVYALYIDVHTIILKHTHGERLGDSVGKYVVGENVGLPVVGEYVGVPVVLG